ncbi:MAG TPA: FkbM family methyltransferase [Candidatus Deferrimicrobiaceae bacterium]
MGNWLGKGLRALLGLIPDGVAVPILQGPLRGKKWITGAHTHGVWLGSYEIDKQMSMMRCIRVGDVFFDVGANTGFYSLFASVLSGPGGRVVAIEPLPRNLAYIRRHVAMNGIDNVAIVGKAVSDRVGTATFAVDGPATSRLAEGGSLTVEVTTIDEISRTLGIVPNVMKVDIEGAEIDMLKGAREVLAKGRPVIFMSLHSGDLYGRLFPSAAGFGYRVLGLDGQPLDAGTFSDEAVLVPGEDRETAAILESCSPRRRRG